MNNTNTENLYFTTILAFIILTIVPAISWAQITVNSNGNAAFDNSVTIDNNATISGNSTVMGTVRIGTTSGNWTQPRLYISANQGSLTHNTAIRGHASGSAWNHFGVYGIADASDGGGDNHRGLIGVASGGSSSNYGVYGSASGTDSWAGYFSGSVYTTGNYQGSDQRLKKNIESLREDGILNKLGQLDPKRYQYLNEEELRSQRLPSLNATEGFRFGLLAQEVEEVFPELVRDVVSMLREETGEPLEEPEMVTTKAINYQELSVLLLAAMQELQLKVEVLENALNETN